LDRSKTALNLRLDRSKTALNLRVQRLHVHNSKTALDVKRAKKASEGARFAVVSMAASRQKKKLDALWRGPVERCVRVTLAWTIHLTVCVLLLFYALILSLKFGEDENSRLFGAWGAAYLWTAILLEPAMIWIMTALPSIANEETLCGRCCLRVKWCWDELLSP